MKRKFLYAGCICFIISFIVSAVQPESDAAALQFVWAALPYVAMGSGMALLFGGSPKTGA